MRRAMFITPMAAVAGSVADEILAVMRARGRDSARAFRQQRGRHRVLSCAGRNDDARPRRPARSSFPVRARLNRRGRRDRAASRPAGARGRSFSLGIADAVTILAGGGAASRCGRDHRRQRRGPARHLAHRARARAQRSQPDSDLGDRLVTRSVAPLDARSRSRRRSSAARRRTHLLGRGLIVARRTASARRDARRGRRFACSGSRRDGTGASMPDRGAEAESFSSLRCRPRKSADIVEEIFHEGGPSAASPLRRGAVARRDRESLCRAICRGHRRRSWRIEPLGARDGERSWSRRSAAIRGRRGLRQGGDRRRGRRDRARRAAGTSRMATPMRRRSAGAAHRSLDQESGRARRATRHSR